MKKDRKNRYVVRYLQNLILEGKLELNGPDGEKLPLKTTVEASVGESGSGEEVDSGDGSHSGERSDTGERSDSEEGIGSGWMMIDLS